MSEHVNSIWKGQIRRRRNMKDIVQEVSERHGVSVASIMGPAQHRRLSLVRFEAYARIRDELQHSYTVIGNFFGRDHTTIMHGVRRHADLTAAKVAAE